MALGGMILDVAILHVKRDEERAFELVFSITDMNLGREVS